jgi:RsmE family RNA methyltransferase
MALFYAPDIEQNPILPEEDSQHAIKVLRMDEGDQLEVIDGKGNYYLAEITIANHKKCGVKILKKAVELSQTLISLTYSYCSHKKY